MVRDARRAKELNQIELAERVGMSQRWISDIERGVTEIPRLDALHRLARVLEIDVADLIYAGNLASSKAGARRLANQISKDAQEDDNAPLTPEEEAILGRISFLGFQTLTNAQLREIIRVVTEG